VKFKIGQVFGVAPVDFTQVHVRVTGGQGRRTPAWLRILLAIGLVKKTS